MAERKTLTTREDRLASLRAALSSAARLVDEVAGDPLLHRFIAAYELIPRQDREVIVGAIERDVQARLLSRATERVTGQAAHPNPNARLYVRAHGHEAQRSDLERDEMMLATLRGMRVMRLLLAPEIHEEWRAATDEAISNVDEETRAVVTRVVRELLGMLEARKPD